MLLFLKAPYVAQVRAGTKTATIRPWKTCTLKRGDPLTFSGNIKATITSVTPRRFDTLTKADICDDGFPSRAAFDAAVAAIYPDLPPDAPCVVLRFRVTRRR